MKIAILNQKGGVGKTTVAVNLAYGLALAGHSTLLIDLDPQAHSTVIFCDQVARTDSIKDVFERKNADIRAAIVPAMVHGTSVAHLDLVPSTIHLAVTAERMLTQHYRERRLHSQLDKLQDAYAFILMDCPPNLGVITVNAIYTADRILIPTTYGRYALDGIADLFTTIEDIRDDLGSCWILRNAFDSRTRATNDYIEKQLDNVRSYVLKTVIRKSEAINQAQISGEPVVTFDPKGYGAADFHALTEEVCRYGKESA
ncbi:MAG: ParA family protein [Candidatus Tectimicrobiota bacterium]